MHGMLKSMVQGQARKRLDIEKIAEIKTRCADTLDPARRIGKSHEDLRKAIGAGINIVHIKTELRVAWRRGLKEGLRKEPDEVVPSKILPFALESVEQVARSRLALFNAAG